MNRVLFILLTVMLSAGAYSMASQPYTVSLLTCGPGNEPYQLFGHTAIKVVYHNDEDKTVLYNYGTFLFDESFMKKFIAGRLFYYLGEENMSEFLSTYQSENRWVTERPLQLDSTQSTSLVKALQWNAQEANKYYLYDFMNNNCCTKPRDLLEKLGVQWNRKNISDFTYRKAVDEYVHNEWMDLGIDLLLGSRVDKCIDNRALMFLPEYLDENVKLARIHGKPVNDEIFTLYQNTPSKSPWIPSPTLVFWIGLLMLIAMQISGRYKKLLTIKSNSILIFTGIIGWLLIYMWLFTDHPYVKNNFNILWAFPLHFPLAFLLWQSKNKKFINGYINFSLLLLAAAILIWIFKIQVFHKAVLPYILLLVWSLQHHRKS